MKKGCVGMKRINKKAIKACLLCARESVCLSVGLLRFCLSASSFSFACRRQRCWLFEKKLAPSTTANLPLVDTTDDDSPPSQQPLAPAAAAADPAHRNRSYPLHRPARPRPAGSRRILLVVVVVVRLRRRPHLGRRPCLNHNHDIHHILGRRQPRPVHLLGRLRVFVLVRDRDLVGARRDLDRWPDGQHDVRRHGVRFVRVDVLEQADRLRWLAELPVQLDLRAPRLPQLVPASLQRGPPGALPGPRVLPVRRRLGTLGPRRRGCRRRYRRRRRSCVDVRKVCSRYSDSVGRNKHCSRPGRSPRLLQFSFVLSASRFLALFTFSVSSFLSDWGLPLICFVSNTSTHSRSAFFIFVSLPLLFFSTPPSSLPLSSC